MSKGPRGSPITFIFIQQEYANGRNQENDDAGIYGERIIYHQEASTQDGSYHATSGKKMG